jgi:hypothetical protein
MRQDRTGQSLDRVLRGMKTLLTKIRGYGWYCTSCKEHKDVTKVNVAKIVSDKYIAIVCSDCSTELVDCFMLKEQEFPRNCDKCEDKFKCFTRADSVIEKTMQSLHSHEVKTSPIIRKIMENIQGVRSYTGIYNDKLAEPPICIYPTRDDCNHSWMRANYNGAAYTRCPYMKYEIKEKRWYCLHGV